ncbi:integrase, catalytic region, zinc finger, CCHC-type containing protein [Tanacetum coccineum]
MTTLADKSLLSGGDNKPPMLEKHLYDSWKSRMELYMLNRPHGRMILASVEKGPLVWPSITVDGVTRLKEYTELTPAEAIQADCDIKAINIILQGLPTEIYALVSQHRVAKDLWEKIKLLMQGTSLTKQERECKLYDEFDKFTYKKGESLHEYYLSKFVTDVKLVKDLHTTNVDQLHAYLQQHERHANEVRLMHERNSDPLALVASHQLTQSAYQSHLHPYPNSQPQHHVSPYPSSQFVTPHQTQQFTTSQSIPLSITYPLNEYQPSVHHNVYSPQSSIPQLEYAPITYQHQQSQFSQPDSGLIVPVFQKGDDPIDAINHMMSFLTAVVTSRYPTTNNQLRTSSNPCQQATIYDEKETMDLSSVTIAKGGSQISKQCTNPKKKGMIRGNFLTPQTSHTVITTMLLIKPMIWMPMTLIGMNLTPAKIALMVNLSRNGSDALTEYLSETQHETAQNSNSSAQQDVLILSILANRVHSKMLLKEQDLMVVKHKVNTKPINYVVLNNDYNKRFVRQSDLYSEHAYWKATLVPPLDPSPSSTTNKVEVPKELPKCLELKTELLNKKDVVDKETYDKLCKSFTTLEKHCITLEADSQLIIKKFFNRQTVVLDPRMLQVYSSCLNKLSKSSSGIWTSVAQKAHIENALSSPITSNFMGTIQNSDDQVAKIMWLRQHTCFIRNLEGVDLLTGSRGDNIYTLLLGNMMASSPICLLSKASKTKSWLWHRRLSHLNFGAINLLQDMDLSEKMTKYDFKKSTDSSNRNNGTEFVNQTLREYYEKVGISHETSVARSPQQNGVVERRNRTLIEAARTMLIYAKAPLFLWAEAVATTCYTQNRSMIRRRHGKTPYELLHDKPPDLSYLHVFGALCYPTNDSENLGKLQPKADIGIFIGYAPTKKAFWIYNRRTRRIIETIHVDFDELTAMASEHSSSGPALHDMTLVTISSGLVPNPPPSTPFSLNPPPYVDLQAPEVIAPIPEVVAPEHAVSTGSPSSTTVDQDAPSPSNSHTTQETQTPIISHDVEEDNHDIEVAHMGNDPYFGIPIPEVTSDQSSSSDVIHTIVPPDHQVSAHNSKWTKDHPLENIIGDLDRPVSTRLQIHEQALFCYYDAFLTSVEPKNYKDALIKHVGI